MRSVTQFQFSGTGEKVAIAYPMHHIRNTEISSDFIPYMDKKNFQSIYYYGSTIIDIFYLTTGELTNRIKTPYKNDKAIAMTFLDNSTKIAASRDSDTIYVYDINIENESKTLRYSSPREAGDIYSMEYSPEKKWLFTSGGNLSREIRIINTNTGNEVTGATTKNWVDSDNKDMHGRTPLHLAAMQGNINEVNRFLSLGANVNSRTGSLMTPLHLAVQAADLDSVKLLIEHGAQINLGNSYKFTALDFAKKSGYIKMIDYLITQGAIGVRDDSDKTMTNELNNIDD